VGTLLRIIVALSETEFKPRSFLARLQHPSTFRFKCSWLF